MKGKRQLLSRIVSTIGLNDAPRCFGALPHLLVLTYHRVLKADRALFPLYPDVIDVSPEDFDRQMALMARHFTPLSASEMAAMIDGDRPWPRHPAAITFDDGYKDNLTEALPILQKHGLKATFFVTAGAVEQRQLFWWDYIWYAVMHCRDPLLRMAYPEPAAFPTDSLAARRITAEALISMVKSAPDVDLSRLKEALAEAGHEEAPERAMAEANVLTWDDVRALLAAGMEVGSHSLSHRVLSHLPEAGLASELQGSKSLLEKRLGAKVMSLAYPAGGVRPHVRRAAAAAGYEIGFGPAGTADRVDRICRYSVHRQGIDISEPFHLFRSTLMIPGVFSRQGSRPGLAPSK